MAVRTFRKTNNADLLRTFYYWSFGGCPNNSGIFSKAGFSNQDDEKRDKGSAGTS